MGNLKGIITKQTFDPEYFKQWKAYDVYIYDGISPYNYRPSILTRILDDVLVFCWLEGNDGDGMNFTVSMDDYVSGKAKIIKLVPETQKDISSQTITSDKYNGDLSHYTDILGKE